MKHILMILTTLSKSDGVASFCLNYYKQIDHNEFKFTFLIHSKEIFEEYKNLINFYGDDILIYPSLSFGNLKNISRNFNLLLSQRHFDVIHCNLPNTAFIYLKIGARYNIPIRIMHSHATKLSDSIIKSVRNSVLWKIGKKYVNTRVACSIAAGNFLFRKRNYTVINNSIDYNLFSFSKEKRESFRKKFKLGEKTIVFVCVGRISKQKNQLFLLKLLSQVSGDFVLFLAGSNSNNSYFKKCKNKFNDKVRYLGNYNEIDHLLCGADCFLMPSKYEGLPVSIIEAQGTGLECILSDKITEEVNLGLCAFLPLKFSYWRKEISSRLNAILPVRNTLYDKRYDASFEVEKLSKIYRGY